MKRKYILIPLLSGVVALSACKDKPKAEDTSAPSPEAPASEVNVPDAPKAAPIQPSASVEERAAKLGFAKRLPKDIQYYGAVYNGRKAFEQFMQTGMGEFLMQRMAEEGMDMADLLESDELAAQVASYSEEYFAAYGKGTGEAFDLVLKLYERFAYYGARTGVAMGDGFVADGEDFEPDFEALFKDGYLKDIPKELTAMLGSFDMPSYYQGAKVSDEETREEVFAQLEQSFSILEMMFDDAAEPITIKRGDVEFSGYKVDGKILSEKIDDDTIEEMQEVIDIADIEAFKKTLASKSFVAVNGIMDDYVITFFGQSEEDLVFVDKAEDSLCAHKSMAFVDSYLSKDLLTVGYCEADVMDGVGSLSSIVYRMVGSFANGLKDGLGDASSLGDTQDVEVLLESLSQQGEKLASLFTVSDSAGVVYLEDGIKIEVVGGSNSPALDLDAPHTFSSLEDGSGTLLFANWVDDKDYGQKMLEYMDTLGETTYMVTKRVAALDIDDPDFNEFKQGVEMFDGTFRNDALGIWRALSADLSAGLGGESALVVDVNGSLPKVPNVPKVLLDEGKMPRIGFVSKVDDRSQLQASWKQINTSAEKILKTVSEMVGEEIPMQAPMSSEKNDLKTWFMAIPFQNDDFVPSVSVSDDLFFASTSKMFSESLAAKYQSDNSKRRGCWMKFDFKVLNQYANEWLTLVDKHAEELIPSESAREDFTTNKPMIVKALKSLESLDEMTLHTRKEDGRQRISFQLKAK
ncbi:hypothetical protein HW115_10735 [Verrucomicrobiaceae bacterium N1E253]|uniref:Lipoprotein n=1 Tax=Oceaniferula marina TaxID=2748318 RepID=A0A851GM01_9BACT|nr:hypothetical protein [Oceaniferula marina]NWK56087.1 hypothetical protein [Oceaniferula marina]